MIFLICAIYAIMALIQIPTLIKKKYWGDMVVYLFFYIFAFVVTILFSLDVKLPSPYKGVHEVLNILKLHF